MEFVLLIDVCLYKISYWSILKISVSGEYVSPNFFHFFLLFVFSCISLTFFWISIFHWFSVTSFVSLKLGCNSVQ